MNLIAQVRQLGHDRNYGLTSSQGNHSVYNQNNTPTAGISVQPIFTVATMSFDQLSSLESQPTTMRSSDAYADDPEFQRLSQDLMTKLFTLTGNISRLTNQIALLGTKRDTERVRERVHDLLEETKDTFKEVGEGVKKIQTWEDVSVYLSIYL